MYHLLHLVALLFSLVLSANIGIITIQYLAQVLKKMGYLL